VELKHRPERDPYCYILDAETIQEIAEYGQEKSTWKNRYASCEY